MEIARRMAMMQKRRELRAAGLGSFLGVMPKTKPFMDYNAEIPFEKQPPKGFYDTSREKPDQKTIDFQRLRLSDLEKESYMEKEKVGELSFRISILHGVSLTTALHDAFIVVVHPPLSYRCSTRMFNTMFRNKYLLVTRTKIKADSPSRLRI